MNKFTTQASDIRVNVDSEYGRIVKIIAVNEEEVVFEVMKDGKSDYIVLHPHAELVLFVD